MTMRGDCCADKAVLGEKGRGRGHPQRKDMSMKALVDDRTPKDSCKFTITPGPCFPMLCLTATRKSLQYLLASALLRDANAPTVFRLHL
ncbi:hypothetical protein OsJ_06143 [Oryza sativa Japonica Group]|uniref:Uncharacterized protein n=1 Tax=Oryza sativa subsp. japonica TaxID=39947 RepID=B9F4V6_ORYSJ|nr:hypothetical protein OsJ_06143 [Oryza sativa Japonica Group]